MGFFSALGTGLGFNVANKLSGRKTASDVAEKYANARKEEMRMRLDANEKREGLAMIQAITFDGDAKSIVQALGNLQVLAGTHGTSNAYSVNESPKAIRNAIFSKMELGIRMLRSAGDAGNAEYFENQLKNMKKKALLANPMLWIAGFVVFLILYSIIYSIVA